MVKRVIHGGRRGDDLVYETSCPNPLLFGVIDAVCLIIWAIVASFFVEGAFGPLLGSQVPSSDTKTVAAMMLFVAALVGAFLLWKAVMTQSRVTIHASNDGLVIARKSLFYRSRHTFSWDRMICFIAEDSTPLTKITNKPGTVRLKASIPAGSLICCLGHKKMTVDSNLGLEVVQKVAGMLDDYACERTPDRRRVGTI